jgi:hypothetical protein
MCTLLKILNFIKGFKMKMEVSAFPRPLVLFCRDNHYTKFPAFPLIYIINVL